MLGFELISLSLVDVLFDGRTLAITVASPRAESWDAEKWYGSNKELNFSTLTIQPSHFIFLVWQQRVRSAYS